VHEFGNNGDDNVNKLYMMYKVANKYIQANKIHAVLEPHLIIIDVICSFPRLLSPIVEMQQEVVSFSTDFTSFKKFAIRNTCEERYFLIQSYRWGVIDELLCTLMSLSNQCYADMAFVEGVGCVITNHSNRCVCEIIDDFPLYIT